MDESLITKQLKDIGLVVKSIEILNGGQTWIHKYIIKTESDKYVLKANTTWDHKRLQEQMDIMRKLGEAETISICPIHDKPIDFKQSANYKKILGLFGSITFGLVFAFSSYSN